MCKTVFLTKSQNRLIDFHLLKQREILNEFNQIIAEIAEELDVPAEHLQGLNLQEFISKRYFEYMDVTEENN